MSSLSQLPWPKIAAITPGHFRMGAQILPRAQALYELGLRMLVLREPQLDRQDQLRLDQELAEHCPQLRLVHHLKCPGSAERLTHGRGYFHFPAHRAIEGLGPGQAAGVSTHDRAELVQAIQNAAAYAFFGPLWPPHSKPRDCRPPLGAPSYRRVLEEFALPIYALGGVSAQRCRALAALPQLRVALIGRLFVAPWEEIKREFMALQEVVGA